MTIPAIFVLMALILSLAVASAKESGATPKLTAKDKRALGAIRAQVASDLRDDVLPFWTRDTLDSEGGFNTIVDRYGKPTSTDKMIVMQARVVWTLSAAQRYGVRNPHYLALASQGV